MELLYSVRRLAFKTFFLILCLAILLWFSIFFYGFVYYLYIPAVAHVIPVYFQYDSGCVSRICKYPSANVTLVKPGCRQLLAGGQKYAIEVALEMPESETNRRQGMFMIKLSMQSQTGTALQTSNRPAVLRYRSPLFRVIYTIFFAPALLAGTFEEKQMLVVPLFENYVEESYCPAHFAVVEIQARVAEIYSSKLQIHAQFTGFRYFMYYWPLSSAFMGIGSMFFTLCVIALVTWMRCVMVTPEDDILNSSSANRPTHVTPDQNKQQRMKEPRPKLLDDEDKQNISLPRHEESIPPTEQVHLGSPQMAVFSEAESELVSSLRKRNL